jgi:hypothetical protein
MSRLSAGNVAVIGGNCNMRSFSLAGIAFAKGHSG